jgi:sulfatase modifying factor 1
LIAKTVVTFGEWCSVVEWAKTQGYVFKNGGKGVSDKHPVTNLSWFDAMKWCNAKSEMEGLAPCYKRNGDVYRLWSGKKASVTCDWYANGYRLPTEAEWEKAARGGLVGKKFPNGDFLEKKDAHFGAGRDAGPVKVAQYPANGYGLYDMAGNVCEWCWDWYAPYYGGIDPKGPVNGSRRVLRGGYWCSIAYDARSAIRYLDYPTNKFSNNGFRLARGRL